MSLANTSDMSLFASESQIKNTDSHNSDIDVNASIFSAIETSAKTSRGQKTYEPAFNRVFMTILFIIFIATLLVSATMGAQTYRAIANDQSKNNSQRLATSLIINEVRGIDSIDAVAMSKGPQGDALILIDFQASGKYENRIYKYNNYIVQEYVSEGEPYSPQNATVLAYSKVFEFSYGSNLLKIVSDEGTAEICLHSTRNL